MSINRIKRIFVKLLGLPPKTKRTCPICNWSGRQFKAGGASHKLRLDSRCPKCGSMERDRLAYLVATTEIELDYSKVLHVAPEPEIEKFLRSRAEDYLSVDLYSEKVMEKMDITALNLGNETKSLVWISHVLEHIPKDDLAISEIYRVLKNSGIAVVQVPIWRSVTYEDWSITNEEDRLKAFHQRDHVRLYGLDIVERFEKAGFKVSVIKAQDFGPDKLIENRLSFASTDEVFILEKGSGKDESADVY